MRTRLVILALTIFCGSLMPAYGQYQTYAQRAAARRQQQQQKMPTPTVDLPEEKPVTGNPRRGCKD